MSKRRKVTVLLWALGAIAAAGTSALGLLAAQDGMVSAWALVAFVWCVAMLAGLAHDLKERGHADRYRLHHKPLAGPREGAQLPS